MWDKGEGLSMQTYPVAGPWPGVTGVLALASPHCSLGMEPGHLLLQHSECNRTNISNYARYKWFNNCTITFCIK